MIDESFKAGYRAGYLAAIDVLRKELALEKIRTEFELNTLQAEMDDVWRMLREYTEPQVRH